MPRKVLLPIHQLVDWLGSIRNDIFVNEGVNIEYLRKRYNSDNKCDIKQRTFATTMNKAELMLPYIRKCSKRLKNSSKYIRYFYFTPLDCPTDIPFDRPTAIPTTSVTDSSNTDQTSKSQEETTTDKSTRTVTPDRSFQHSTASKANETHSYQDLPISENPNKIESPLTLLSRAALCLENMDYSSDESTTQPSQPKQATNHTHIPSLPFVFPTNTTSPFTPEALSYINQADTLSFVTNPRPDPRYIPSSSSTPGIISHIHEVTRLPPEMKVYMVMQAKHHGLEDLSKPNQEILMESILKTESYLEGYPIQIGSIRSFQRWHAELKKKEIGSASLKTISEMFRDKSGNCTVPFTTKLQQLYPKLLHSLFRYAGNTHGYDANNSILISSMNSKSKALHPDCPVRGKLALSKYNFTRFFQENKGIIKRPTTKPRLTKKHKVSRVVFSKKNKRRLNRKKMKGAKHVKFHYCFIDEKWFYIFTNRKKRKYLPAATFENLSDVIAPARKIRSRRHVTKVMFMGIIAPPDLQHDFDGKIMLKRVSRQTESKQVTHHQRFSVNYHINQLIKDGEWKEACLLPGMVGWQLFETIQDTYDLEDDVGLSLVLTYRTFNTDKVKNIKVIRVDRSSSKEILDLDIRTEQGGPLRKIKLDDLTLHVRVERGSVAETDVNCDTAFMMDTIDEIGSSIRDKMKWVPKTDPIHLFIDNAGGHGTDEGKSKYEEVLKEKYNVILNWQVPNSPETNMLDLGAWMTIQSVVEELHRQRLMNEDALADTVMQAFEEFDGNTKLAAINARWELVLDLIIEDKGGNDLVETKRGTLTKTLKGKRLPNSDIYNQERIPLVVDDSDEECDNEESVELI